MHSAPADFRVKELVGYGRMPHQGFFARMNGEDERIVDEAMKATGTYHLRDKSIHEISGGETQRVWIATVLTQQPEILFLDEPTTYLDIQHQLNLMTVAQQMAQQGTAVVLVLHDLCLALRFSHRCVLLQEGQMVQQGTPEEVFQSGALDQVFQTRICRVDTPDGWRYYYD